MNRRFAPIALVIPFLIAAGCASSSAPAGSTDASKATTTEPAKGIPADHPYRQELANFLAPTVCKLYGPGWSGDGELVIKDGKVVSFEAGTTSVDPADPSKPVWAAEKAPDLVGKEVPPIPKDVEPFLKNTVYLSVGCM